MSCNVYFTYFTLWSGKHNESSNHAENAMWAYAERDGRPRNTGGALCLK